MCQTLRGKYQIKKCILFELLKKTDHPLQKEGIIISLRKLFENIRSIPMIPRKNLESM